MREAQKEYKWKLDFGEIAADLARRLHHPRALPPEDHRGLRAATPSLVNLLLDPYFKKALAAGQENWRKVVALAVRHGIPVPDVQVAPCPTTTATARPGCRPTCCRPSATTSAPTPTSASTSRAGSSSTSTGRTPSARSCPSDPRREPARRDCKHETGGRQMSTITTKDGTEIFYKDWGPKNAQPIVFHHGWPLSADDWDTQMLYFLEQGLSRHRPRPARPRPLEPGQRRPRHGPLRRRRRRGRRASRPAQRHPHRPFDRRRRGDALRRPPRHRAASPSWC